MLLAFCISATKKTKLAMAHLEQELQINTTLESSASMMRREEMAPSKPHCIKICQKFQKVEKTALNYPEGEICFEGMNQPVEKHKGEIDQEKESISILGVLHKNC